MGRGVETRSRNGNGPREDQRTGGRGLAPPAWGLGPSGSFCGQLSLAGPLCPWPLSGNPGLVHLD